MAHGVEDGIIKLNGPGDEESGVWWLAGHVLWWFRGGFLGLLGLLDLGLDWLNLVDLCLGFFWLLGYYAVAVFVFEASGAFGSKGRVQFEEGLGI